jgi:hypothetical protein
MLESILEKEEFTELSNAVSQQLPDTTGKEEGTQSS